MKLVVNPVKIEIYDEEMHGHIVATAEAVDGIVARVEIKQVVGWNDWLNITDAVRKAMHMMGVMRGLRLEDAQVEHWQAILTTSPAAQPCPTCEALARTVMMDQTAHDTQRQPLTDEEIRKFADTHLFYQPEGYEVSGIFNLARAIEAAHGIGENT